MSEFRFDCQDFNGWVVIRTVGYFNDLAAEKVETEVNRLLKEGKKRFLFNFKLSEVINSVGISILIGIIESIVEEHQGEMRFCHLTDTNRTTFEMMGLFQDAAYFPTEPEAVQ